jgi:hypothetical protein
MIFLHPQLQIYIIVKYKNKEDKNNSIEQQTRIHLINQNGKVQRITLI